MRFKTSAEEIKEIWGEKYLPAIYNLPENFIVKNINNICKKIGNLEDKRIKLKISIEKYEEQRMFYIKQHWALQLLLYEKFGRFNFQ